MGNPDRDANIDPLHLDPHTAEKFKSDERVHEPSTMRSIATALSQNLQSLERTGIPGPTLAEVQIGSTQFGEWTDAKIFGATAGKDSAGQKLGRVHAEFVKAYKNVIAAIEASAGNHAEADARNESA
ncbi:hypothetical protein [Nonomuraea sp. NPDC050202]|uniref:hypothetical protein n=1 Tax=Nonomuraea sp. NPDC050202 TaxID=3155035 RepID=UPI0033F0E31B